MKKQNASSKKVTKVAVASVLGLALLTGGSTYALWSSNATANTGGTITTGDLQVSAAAPQKWFDVSTATPVEIASLADYRLAPGDTIKLKQDINVIVVGDNISGILTVNVPKTTSAAILAQAKFVLTILDKDGNIVGSSEQVGLNNLNVVIDELPQTSATGEKYTAEISVELPASADDATKQQTISLSNISIVLDQGPAL